MVTPSRYYYKSLKWVHRIEILAEDRLGFWEQKSNYHNEADPWRGDQRFISGSIPPQMLKAFRKVESFDRYRGEVVYSADLHAWEPKNLDLHGIQLKNCDLRQAKLDGAILTGSNLTLSNLRGASLREAVLDNTDLEGAYLADADLSGADLTNAKLAAATFFEKAADGRVLEAKVEGFVLKEPRISIRSRQSSCGENGRPEVGSGFPEPLPQHPVSERPNLLQSLLEFILLHREREPAILLDPGPCAVVDQ